MRKELEIYIHIPFCKKKCAYCDFLSGPADDNTIAYYVEKLIGEIGAQGDCNLANENTVTSVFFGGGTPSILNGRQMQRIMKAIKLHFRVAEDAEISVEANPGTVNREKLVAYKKAGVNRISFGLQSAKNEELKLLGRIHTFEDFLESFWLARECGFENINVDLISAIPGQTLKSWEESLRQVLKLNPEHLSAYSLIIEEGTPFATLYGEGTEEEEKLPTEEDERRMYWRTKELLEEAGYYRYEISNYAKPGKECRHNFGYWERKNYLGMGLGSSSLFDNVRWKNIEDLEMYLKNSGEPEMIQKDREILSVTEQMEEFVFLGLRKTRGICMKEFEETFGKSLEECYGENVARMQREKLVIIEDGFLRLTEKGIDVSNYVFGEILREKEIQKIYKDG